MEEKAINNFNVRLEKANKVKQVSLSSHWVKVTFKTRLNSNVMSNINLNTNVDAMLDGLTTDDYLSLAAYNIKTKVYLNKRVRLISSIWITGVETQTYYYSGGLIVKF